MSKAKTKFAGRRVLSAQETANYLGMSYTTFCKRREKLYADGFPRPLKEPWGGYDLGAIDNYFDRRSGLEQTAVAPDDGAGYDPWK